MENGTWKTQHHSEKRSWTLIITQTVFAISPSKMTGEKEAQIVRITSSFGPNLKADTCAIANDIFKPMYVI